MVVAPNIVNVRASPAYFIHHSIICVMLSCREDVAHILSSDPLLHWLGPLLMN